MTFIFIHLHLQLALMATMEPPPLGIRSIELKRKVYAVVGVDPKTSFRPSTTEIHSPVLKKTSFNFETGPC